MWFSNRGAKVPDRFWTQQVSDLQCFAACLQAFLAENGVHVDQNQMIDDCPLAFRKGSKLEGALHIRHLAEVARKYSISFTEMHDPVSPTFPHHCLFFFDKKHEDLGFGHCTRLVARQEDRVILHDPNSDTGMATIALAELCTQPLACILVEFGISTPPKPLVTLL